ncbi:hypothetical protein F5Y01DRAFT_161295 [Xylaria sp. FL0043]|nr:hypothetical protein F5Y01DRAFT_161295 [Xylaria sp. FL0043]
MSDRPGLQVKASGIFILIAESSETYQVKLSTTLIQPHLVILEQPSIAITLPRYRLTHKMPHTTFSSTSTSSDSVPRTFTLGQASSYPRELDIDGSSSGTSTSGGTTSPPLMAYSTPFTSNWRKDFGSSTNTHRQYQERSSWSTKGNAGSNP